MKNNTVGAHPGMHVNLVRVEITLWDSVRGTSTQMWTIRNLPPGDSATNEVESLYNNPGVTSGPAKVAQRFYAEIIESDPAESLRFGFNNATEHWAIELRRPTVGNLGVTRFTNGDFVIDNIRISDRSPQPGGATTFTVPAYNDLNDNDIPGIIRSRQDHDILDVQVEISLSPGLSFADTQPEAPSTGANPTTFDTSTGIWNVGTMTGFSRDTALSLPVAVNLTTDNLADLSMEERCLTAKVVSAQPWFADPLKQANNTATACLGKALLDQGEIVLFYPYDCVDITASPCTDGDTVEMLASLDDYFVQPELVIVRVRDPIGRVHDTHTGSVGYPSWQTARDHVQGAHQVKGVKIGYTRAGFNNQIADWSNLVRTVTVSGLDGGEAPGRVKIRFNTASGNVFFDPNPTHERTPFRLNTASTVVSNYFLEFSALGTYVIEFTAKANRADTTENPNFYTDTGRYIFHVGPAADLEVRDALDNPEVATGRNAYTILAVNKGPDPAPDVRVTLTGAPEGAEAHLRQGEYVESNCQNGLCKGVWTIGYLSPVSFGHAEEGPTLTLIAASGDPITAEIESTQNYCVQIKDDDPRPENDLECAGSVQTGYTEHSIAYYDHIEGNSTTTVELRAGGLQGRHPGAPSTTVAIHGAELALLSWSPVKNLYGYPVTRYEIERSERGASPDWDEFEDADAMFHYAHVGGGGGNLAYRVRAVNEFGVPGPWSQVATEAQTVRGPSAPGGLMATVDGTSVTLTWDAPTDNRGSAVTGYSIRYSIDGDLETPITHATTTRMYEHTGLLQGRIYCYGVAAVNGNGVGDFSDWVCKTTEDVPGAPASLRATVDGKDTVRLTWNEPAEDGGSPITDYRIEYSTDAGRAWQGLMNDPVATTTTYIHTGLNAGTSYCYRVAAINDNGPGQFSGQACATTETVPGAPRSLRATAKGENAVTLNWRAPSSDGGSAVTGYRIEHSTDDGENWGPLVSDTATTTREYEHESLSAGSRHCYRVAAINTHGEGPLSGQACATTDGAPAAPWNLSASPSSETSITLSWNEPSDDGGSAITGYLVEYYDGAEWLTLASAHATTMYEHTERDAGTNYCYRVAAVNSNGTGPYSGQACATTAGSPDAPENLRAVAHGKTRITLTWDAPTDTGGATIIGYRIDYSTDGGGEWMALELDYERTTYGHSGLSPGGSYCYRVAAVHDNGTGPFSEQVCATTEGSAATDLPGEPENLRLTAVGRNHVTLKWDPPSLGGEVEYYEYRYNQEDPVRVTGRTEATVRGLFEGFSYDFQVRANNSLGAGEWAPSSSSLPVQATVGGMGIVPRPLELEIKKNAHGDYGSGSFNVKLSGSPKWPMSVGLLWEGDVCLTDNLVYQQFRILLPSDPSPSKEFWNDPYWAGTTGSWRTGIDINVDASRCRGGETAVVYLDLTTLAFESIAGASLWDDEALNLDRAEWEQKWGIPDEFQTGPSVKLSAVE